MPLPINYKTASVVRRTCAAFINFLAFGFLVVVSGLVTGNGIWSHEKSEREKLVLLGLFTLLWLVSIATRSPGSFFCLLKSLSAALEPLRFRMRFLWNLPYFVLGVIAVGPFPSSRVMWSIQGMLLCAGLLVLAVDGAVLVITGSSLRDRWMKVAVFQLSLPDHLKPRLFGLPLA